MYSQTRLNLILYTVGRELVSLTTRESWVSGVRSMPKLCIYCKVQQDFGTENYVQYNLLKKKSVCAKVRPGLDKTWAQRKMSFYG